MSFVSVYRRWRPKTFEEIIGQERITRTLQNAIRAGRTSHAYLFAGHRGTGKTTTARILAKALNCAAGPTPTPDNTCPMCVAISRGVSMDVIEIDGASNTSVDDVRDLKEKIVLAPTEGRSKVYIIDEVHMLSTSAFNALLKTLEEPPAHAVFILVTTEPQRIPPTVLSRCQRFDFRRVSFAEITGRLRAIAQAEGITIDDEALAQIVRNADGSVRDAESVLDQLSAYIENKRIDRDLVTSVLGLVDDETARAFAGAVLDRDVASTLRLAQEATDGGKDIRQVLRTLLEYFRDLLLVKTCGPAASQILDAPPERLAQLSSQVERAEVSNLLRAVRVLNDAVTDARWSAQPRLALEVALIRLARPEMDSSTEGMLARIERLEAGGAESKASSAPSAPPGRPAPSPTATPPARTDTPPARPAPQPRPGPARRPTQRTDAAEPVTGSNGQDSEAPTPSGAPGRDRGGLAAAASATQAAAPAAMSASPANPVVLEEVRRQWARVLEDIKRTKMICHALLIEGTPMEVNGNVLVVGLRSAYNFHVDNLNRSENREIVEGALSRVLGRAMRFHCRLYETPAQQPTAVAGESPEVQTVTTRVTASAGTESSFLTRAKELFGAEVIDDDGPAQ